MLLSHTMKASAAGFLGAIVLTALHQTLKNVTPKAPALDKLGMQSIERGARALNQRPPEALYEAAIAGDLVSNAAYFAMAGAFGRSAAPLTGAALGIAAGLGAIALPRHLGLDENATARSAATKALTVGLYASGGLVAGTAYRML